MKQDIIKFLNSQKLLILATVGKYNNPWTSNLYFSNDDDLNLYFISKSNAKHSLHLNNNFIVACSIAWYSKSDLSNRKGIQAVGKCLELNSKNEIEVALLSYNKKFNSNRTYKDLSGDSGYRIYKVSLSEIKFWNDELFGEEKTKEIKL